MTASFEISPIQPSFWLRFRILLHEAVLMVGMACGGAIGLVIGVIKLSQFLTDYRDLTKEE